MRWISVLALLALTACGADGEPEPFLNAGLSIGSGGVSVGGAVGASNGPVTVAVGF
ncbi:MAG: hypothetical protein AAGF78_04210 [Pseudomonadota bacterium]